MSRVVLDWATVYANTQSPTKLFIPVTGWLDASTAKYARAVWELVSPMTNISVEFGYQTANVENAPDAAVAISGALTAAGVSYGSKTDISSATANKNMVRFGFMVTNTAAASLVLGRAGGYVETDDC